MSTFLDVRTAITVVQQALTDAISLAFQYRFDEVADLAALAGIASVKVPDRGLRFVASEGCCYRFHLYSTSAELLPSIVQPTDRTTNGRWIRCDSTVTYGPAHFRPLHRVRTGYARSVQVWEGEGGSAEALDRIFASTPAFLVQWTGDHLISKGNHPRGINQVDMSFAIWCFSKNYRPQNQGLWGSEVAAEIGDAKDPGLNRMMGDIRYLLAGADLGLSPGVRYVDIQGSAQISHEDLDNREFVGTVPIVVKASYNIPDEDLVPISEIAVQFQDVGLGDDDEFDADNYIAAGLKLNAGPGAGLVGTVTPGAAYIAGALVSSQPGAWTFTASKDTYIDLLPTGFLTYSPVDVGADAPALPAGALRLGLVRTDAADIISYAPLCDYLTDSGEPFVVRAE